MSSTTRPATLCVNMIVRQEEAIIERCLTALVGLVTEYAILDTGSTDATLERIRSFQHFKGATASTVFHNFEQARNEALCFAHATTTSTHVLLVDADMVVVVHNHDELLRLLNTHTSSIFHMTQSHGALEYINTRIVPSSLLPEVRYVGVTHEFLSASDNYPRVVIPKDVAYIKDVSDGGCKHDKCERDIRLLTTALEQADTANADTSRYCFYLAQSYSDAGQLDKAIEFYLKRASMKDTWVEEISYSFIKLIHIFLYRGDEQEALSALQRLQATNVKRPEGYYAFTKYYREKGVQAEAIKYLMLTHQNIPTAADPLPLFYDSSIASYLLYYEATILLWYFDDAWWRQKGKDLSEYLLSRLDIPDALTQNIQSNYDLYYTKFKSA